MDKTLKYVGPKKGVGLLSFQIQLAEGIQGFESFYLPEIQEVYSQNQMDKALGYVVQKQDVVLLGFQIPRPLKPIYEHNKHIPVQSHG